MSITMHITITTKDGCFDEFHALAKEELVFIRGSKGCLSIRTSSSRDTNTLKFAEVWKSEEDFNTYFAKRVERSGDDFGRLLLGPPEKECFQTDDWGYKKKSGKNNYYATKNFGGEKYLFSALLGKRLVTNL